MSSSLRKIFVRIGLASVIILIALYIFAPSSTDDSSVNFSTTTTTVVADPSTTISISDLPCSILFNRDEDTFLVPDNPCLQLYADKYAASVYAKLQITCRSSSDGDRINRQTLSDKRIKNVQFSLLKLGVKYEDMITTSLGDQSPVAGVDPSSAEGKLLNRSCDITGVRE